MSESLIYIVLFALLFFFMHRGHGGMGGCGGHSHHGHGEKKSGERPASEEQNDHAHHH